MAETTGISWTDATWSPVTGCSKVSPGCDHCYAATFTERLEKSGHHRKYGGLARNGNWTGEVRCHPDVLEQPLHWKRPRRIFVNSMSDTFHDKVPRSFQCQMFDIMEACPQHIFQVLTKRPGQMAYFADPLTQAALGRPGWRWPDHVWAGTSVESQKYAPRLDVLARVPAKVRFVSAEPLLGPLDLRKWLAMCECGDSLSNHLDGKECCLWQPGLCSCTRFKAMLNWVICGGESGPGHRPMDLVWLESLAAQCVAAGVPLWVKQASGLRPGQQGHIPDALWATKEMP